MAAHLMAVGHRSIAFITDADDVSTGRERREGLQQALAEAHIEFSESLVLYSTTDQLGGYRSAQQILNMQQRPTAIFTVNNMVAVGVMQAMREANV